MVNGVYDSAKTAGQMAGRNAQNDRLMDACRQFESLLLAQMLKEMRDTVPEGGVIPRSSGEKIFQEMLDSEYANQMSKSNPVGLAAMLYRQLQPAGLGSAQVNMTEAENQGRKFF